jgi:hypothetical protein
MLRVTAILPVRPPGRTPPADAPKRINATNIRRSAPSSSVEDHPGHERSRGQGLVCAVARLETLGGESSDLREAGNALEDVAYHLGQMAPDERQQLLDAVERLASDEADSATADWIRGCRSHLASAKEPPTT